MLGLAVEARELDVSAMLLPAGRRILVTAAEPEPRRRFTIAHELGPWICRRLEGLGSGWRYCRAEEVGFAREAKSQERRTNILAANLWISAQARQDAGRANSIGATDDALGRRLYNFDLTGHARLM